MINIYIHKAIFIIQLKCFIIIKYFIWKKKYKEENNANKEKIIESLNLTSHMTR